MLVISQGAASAPPSARREEGGAARTGERATNFAIFVYFSVLPPLTLPTLRNTASAPVPSPNSAASPSSAPNIAQHRVCTQPHPRHRAILRTTPPTPAPVVCSPCRPSASLNHLSAQPPRSPASARDCAPPPLPSPTADPTPRITAPTPAHAACSPCHPSLHRPPVPRCRRRAAQRLSIPTASPTACSLVPVTAPPVPSR